MVNRDPAVAAEDLHTLFSAGTVTALSDAELLERFLSVRGHAADAVFGALVQRHGAMVMRVCGEILGDLHASEDAFQATFLILASRARSIRKRESVASWLFGVARRVAIRVRAERARQAALERRAPAKTHENPYDRSALDVVYEVREAVERLPEKYRAPIVLCDLGGLTHEQAAYQLRLPVGTVKVRLHRARNRLRGRLIRRGLAPTLAALTAAGNASSAAPLPRSDSLIQATTRIAAQRGLAASSSVATLVTGVLRAMLLTKLKSAAILGATGLAVIVVGAFTIPVSLRPAHSAQTPAAAADTAVVKVTVASAKRSDIDRISTQPGSVHPFESVAIYPKSAGYLKRVEVDIGDSVRAGQVLAELEVPELTAETAKNQALVKQAEARVARVKAALKVAGSAVTVAEAGTEQTLAEIARYAATVRYRETELARHEELFKQRAVPQSVLDEEQQHLDAARASVVTAKSQLSGVKAKVEEARAKLDESRGDVDEALAALDVAKADLHKSEILQALTIVRSPFDGVVNQRNCHSGAFVRAGADGGGQPMLEITKTDRMRVVTHVPDSDVPFLQKGERATITLNAFPDRVFEGKVARTAYAEDPESRTLRAEIDLDNTDGRLRPGLYGQVAIYLAQYKNRLSIPASAVIETRRGGEATCFRVQGGRAVRTEIKIGAGNGTDVEVLEGLKEGDTVIADPHPGLSDGQAIEQHATAATPPKP